MAERETKLKKIPIEQITESSSALRKPNVKDEKYQALVDSVQKNGILNPISVREIKDPTTGDTRFAVIDGLHRFYAARDAGLSAVPAQIMQMNAEEVRLAQIIGNVQKIETKPAQYSEQLVRILTDNPSWTEKDLADRLSRSEAWVLQRLKINTLPDKAKALVDDHKITLVNAFALADLQKTAPEEVENYLERAQTDSPATFTPQINNRIKAIKDARREGRVPKANTEYEPYPHLRRNAEIKDEFTTPKFAAKIVAATEAKTPLDGFAAGIAWVLRMDPISVQEDTDAFERKKSQDAETKRLAKEEADRQKSLKAAHAVQNA